MRDTKAYIVPLIFLGLIILVCNRPVCIEVVTKKADIVYEDSTPVLKESVQSKQVVYIPDPSDIPVTRPWVWRGGDGARNLREHIIMTHGVESWKIQNFKTQNQLNVLHSYLHNGGKL